MKHAVQVTRVQGKIIIPIHQQLLRLMNIILPKTKGEAFEGNCPLHLFYSVHVWDSLLVRSSSIGVNDPFRKCLVTRK